MAERSDDTRYRVPRRHLYTPEDGYIIETGRARAGNLSETRAGCEKMKQRKETVPLDRAGIDAAAETIQRWLTEAGVDRKDVLRIRLTAEELLARICDRGETGLQAELSLVRRLGACRLRIRYGGARFDPCARGEDGLEEFSADILARTGFLPAWRSRGGINELNIRVPARGLRPEYVLLGCIVAAVLIGLLGERIPETVRSGVTDYALSFLSGGFMNLLNTFIGLMIFLSIVTGVSGIGSASSFGRIGKLMISRFIGSSFLFSGILILASMAVFRIGGGGGGASQTMAVLEMLFGILPSNPVRPFLEGNNLQIIFIGVLVGVSILLAGNKADGLRRGLLQAQNVVMRCVSFVCVFLPVYIFSSLTVQIWDNGAGIFLRLWKPFVFCIGIALFFMAVHLAAVCWKLKVKASVLLPKLMPDYLIGLSTASASAAFSTTLETNEQKLGIEPSFSRTAAPIGSMLSAGTCSMFMILSAAFLAECYGVGGGPAWWITLWVVGTLLTMAIPPVAGGGVSCLSILLVQMGIPRESLPLGVTLMMFMDFVCTSTRIFTLHCEMLLQADRLGLLDHELLRRKC